jgi:hypothetical protein
VNEQTLERKRGTFSFSLLLFSMDHRVSIRENGKEELSHSRSAQTFSQKTLGRKKEELFLPSVVEECSFDGATISTDRSDC